MIVSFLISQQNNIPRIRRCISNICERYGERKQGAEEEFTILFPVRRPWQQPVRKNCGLQLGYRSRYVKKTAQMILEGQVSLEEVQRMDYLQAREELQKLYGVGAKVADCICLFALHQMRLFLWTPISARPWKNIIPRHSPLSDIKTAAASCSSTYFTENFCSKIKTNRPSKMPEMLALGYFDFI